MAFASADTVKSINTASDYSYVVAQSVPYWKLPDKSLSCNCVLFAKDYLGITRTLGIAKYIKPTSQEPRANSIVITDESELGHVAVVLSIIDDKLFLIEGNYRSCQVTYRTLNVDDSRIKGYVY